MKRKTINRYFGEIKKNGMIYIFVFFLILLCDFFYLKYINDNKLLYQSGDMFVDREDYVLRAGSDRRCYEQR